ncbi:MAG: hypothetical protein DMG59_20005 [Acidobacteria bacterium]|nr:MAG: hypothetical protein DMG59_20005 [Acidobacteriota bacterium]
MELYLLFCLSSRMWLHGFVFGVTWCAEGNCEKTFGLAEPTYKKIAPVAQSIPICALCTDDALFGNWSVHLGDNVLTI